MNYAKKKGSLGYPSIENMFFMNNRYRKPRYSKRIVNKINLQQK